MKRIASILAIALMAVLVVTPFASTATITCSQPILATSAGQSAGLDTAMAVMDLATMYYDTCDAPQNAHIASGVGIPAYTPKPGEALPLNVNRENDRPATAKYAKGTKYQTVMFIMGASTKGMGASGLNIETELKRVNENITWCRSNNVKMIGWQLEGVSQRSKAGSDNERIYDAVTPNMNQLLVIKSANDYDNKFSTVASQKSIPIEIYTSARDAAPILKKIFGL